MTVAPTPAGEPPAAERTAPVDARFERRGAAARLVLSGRLDATTLASVWSKVIGPLEASPPSQVAVDVSRVRYCDGAGVGPLVGIDRQVRGRGGTVTFEHMGLARVPFRDASRTRLKLLPGSRGRATKRETPSP